MSEFWKAVNNPSNPDPEGKDLPNLEEADDATFEDLTQDTVVEPEAEIDVAASRRRRHEKASVAPVELPPDFTEETEKEPTESRPKWPFIILIAGALVLLLMIATRGGGGDNPAPDDQAFVDRGSSNLAISSYTQPVPLNSQTPSGQPLAPGDTPNFTIYYMQDQLKAQKIQPGEAPALDAYFPTDKETAAAVKLLNMTAKVILNNDHDGFLARNASTPELANHLTRDHLPFTVYSDVRAPLGGVSLIGYPGSETLLLTAIANEEGYPLMKRIPIGPIPESLQGQFYLNLNSELNSIQSAKERAKSLGDVERYLDQIFIEYAQAKETAAQVAAQITEDQLNEVSEQQQENQEEIERVRRQQERNQEIIEEQQDGP